MMMATMAMITVPTTTAMAPMMVQITVPLTMIIMMTGALVIRSILVVVLLLMMMMELTPAVSGL